MDFFHKTNPIKQNWFDGYFFHSFFLHSLANENALNLKKKQSQTEQQKKTTRPE